MLQNNYISESEGLILVHAARGTEVATVDDSKRPAAKSGLLTQLQGTAMTALKSTTAVWDHKTLTNKSRPVKRNSSMHNTTKRNRSSLIRR